MKRTLDERREITEYYEQYGGKATQERFFLNKNQVKMVVRWYRKTLKKNAEVGIKPKHILDDTMENITLKAIRFALDKYKGSQFSSVRKFAVKNQQWSLQQCRQRKEFLVQQLTDYLCN